MLTYLASPYTHPDPAIRIARFRQACRAAAALMQQGEIVFSPIAHSHPIAILGNLDCVDLDFWQRQDEWYVRNCARVVVLTIDGWDKSRGVAGEIALAESLGKPVEYLTLEQIIGGIESHATATLNDDELWGEPNHEELLA